MQQNIKSIIVNAGIEIIVFILIGILALGSNIIVPNNTGFSFTIFGFAAVVFYYLLTGSGLKNFITLGTLLALLLVIIFKTSDDVLVLIRDFFWFPFIGAMVFVISLLEKKVWFNSTKLWIAAVWFLGFAAVYIIMGLLNIYIFGLYRISARINLFFYLSHAVKIGGVLGIGIGLGKILKVLFIKGKLSQA